MQAAQRKKATKGDFAVAAVILAAAILLMPVLFSGSKQAPVAQVMLDGEVVLTCRLDELRQPMQYEIDGAYPLTLELSEQGVRVLETSCPGEDCLHTGMISQANRQIVCLPNRLVVSLTGADEGFDAVTG